MKTIKLTTALLGSLVMLGTVNCDLEANQGKPQEVIAIQIDKPAPKNIRRIRIKELEAEPERVPVQERKDDRASLKEQCIRERQNRCICELCKRRINYENNRPIVHGRVPVGQTVGRYGQGVVIHPAGRTPKKVLVHPSPHCCYDDEYSIKWSVSGSI